MREWKLPHFFAFEGFALKIMLEYANIYLNGESYGHSAHNRSSQLRVGSLSRIGGQLKTKEPAKEK